ncbi:hypothetical protein SAMD00019534_065610 [Acytostelium subglobosum LB1]|uniref:hypothetical protein n=1 Tax=Acytostelium subglobosum LB1 TaxID=1410327 RepID=UPI000644A0A6|nr:hypothetical protein SAMD00019534_065610 [Acytostelium subglobosum LB1]GAM23386.1 hypothetical protein SAMD00019534_065610 [Acytostelium subglobosum LB1]|eukprot:XP_012753835.1 hypothetical protein SAMD00019534_065610 [Acytostelium subglobosum LB1]
MLTTPSSGSNNPSPALTPVATNPPGSPAMFSDKKFWRPLWIPDDQEDRCLNCSNQFNTLLRRHHCRQCGNIFCNNCSSKRQSLPQLHYDKPVRICNRCSDLANFSKLATSDDVAQRVEASKGFCNLTLDALGRKLIVNSFLGVMFSLLDNRLDTSVYRHVTRAVANLAENEINRTYIIESELFDALVHYLLTPHDDDNETRLNVCICFEYLACEENILVKTQLAEQCLPILMELSRSYNGQLKHSSSIILLNLTKNPITRDQVVKAGVTQSFIAMALCDEVSLQAAATQAISILSLNPKNQRKIVEGGALPPLILMINSPVEKIILYTVASLASLSENSDNQLAIGQVGGVKPMINILHYSNDDKIPLHAATTLYHLSLCPSNHALLMQQDLFDILSKVIIVNYANTSSELLFLSIKILSNLSNVKEGKQVIRKNQALMNVLRIMVHTTNKLQPFSLIIFNNCESN